MTRQHPGRCRRPLWCAPCAHVHPGLGAGGTRSPHRPLDVRTSRAWYAAPAAHCVDYAQEGTVAVRSLGMACTDSTHCTGPTPSARRVILRAAHHAIAHRTLLPSQGRGLNNTVDYVVCDPPMTRSVPSPGSVHQETSAGVSGLGVVCSKALGTSSCSSQNHWAAVVMRPAAGRARMLWCFLTDRVCKRWVS